MYNLIAHLKAQLTREIFQISCWKTTQLCNFIVITKLLEIFYKYRNIQVENVVKHIKIWGRLYLDRGRSWPGIRPGPPIHHPHGPSPYCAGFSPTAASENLQTESIKESHDQNSFLFFRTMHFNNKILHDKEADEELILLVILYMYIKNNFFNIFK